MGTVTRPRLTRFAWLSIATAVVTISLKATAYFLTGSVGLLSDALESIVNLVAAVGALVALIVAAQPADEDHAYGHTKAEYFSSGFEGGLIVLAAASIIAVAVPRLLHPEPLADAALGLAISTPGSVLNGLVAWRLMRAGKQYHSITLEADGRHLLADVWTSIGVLVGVAAVAVTGLDRLDPTIALVVAANIVWTGVGLVRRSALGLLDTALPADQRDAVQEVLTRYEREYGIRTHALRTRQAGSRGFVSVHVLVPGTWTVDRGHSLLDEVEQDIRTAIPGVTVFTHLESLDDPASWADTELDRDDEAREAQPSDDRGGHRGAHATQITHRHAGTSREAQPGDDRGSHGRQETQPGDDRGGDRVLQSAREAQPGDDRGGDRGPRSMRETQPGDDRGGHGHDG